MLLHRMVLAGLLSCLSLSAGEARTICTVVADAGSGKLLHEQGSCNQRVTPASTFKIAISLMGYDSGFLQDAHTPALPFKAGYADWIPVWRRTTDPTSWITNSVVWYSQRITEWLGETRFQNYVSAFQYGNEDVSGDPDKHNGLTQAWLSSSLQISPREQLSFLRTVASRHLPLSEHAFDMTDKITRIGVLPSGWEIHGKTGTGMPILADGTQDRAHVYGWFIGWAAKEGQAVVFARLVQDEHQESDPAGLRARSSLMNELPALLDMASSVLFHPL